MTTQRIRKPALAALAAASIFAAGCGGSAEDDVKDTVKDLAAAAKDKDAEKFCGFLSKKALDEIDGGCEKTLTGEPLDTLAKDAPDPDEIKFDKVTVKDEKATVTIDGEEDPTKMVKEDGEWKFSP